VRTTLDIEDEILLTVKEIALQRKVSAGRVVSSLLREALNTAAASLSCPTDRTARDIRFQD
jgi:predicted DNA-binding ribbon-helix-helix protein